MYSIRRKRTAPTRAESVSPSCRAFFEIAASSLRRSFVERATVRGKGSDRDRDIDRYGDRDRAVEPTTPNRPRSQDTRHQQNDVSDKKRANDGRITNYTRRLH